MPETNEAMMKVVGKSAKAVNRVVDILMGVDAEFRVPQQGLALSARPGVKDFDAKSHWWRDDAEFDDETGFWSLELEGEINRELGFPAICQALDVGIELYTANRRQLEQKYLAVSHLGAVTANNDECFEAPDGHEDQTNDAPATELKPDDWGWSGFGFFESDEKVYAGAAG